MKNISTHEKLLILIALVLGAGVIFYNAFFIPSISIPTVIYVEKESTTETLDSETSQSDSSGLININTASESELDEALPGIGPTLAKRIIEYRTSNGNFKTIDEIKNVSGIGESIFGNIKDLICV